MCPGPDLQTRPAPVPQVKNVMIRSYNKIYRDAQAQRKTNKYCAVHRFNSGEELRLGVSKVYVTGGPMKMLYAQKMVRDLHNPALTDNDFKFDHPMDAVVKGAYNYGLEMESGEPVSEPGPLWDLGMVGT